MFTRILTCLLSGAVLLCILATAPARATDFYATDGVTLAAAVAAANDETANPGADTIYLEGNPTCVLLLPLDITSDVTIEGPGTLTGPGWPIEYLIGVTGENVTFTKVTFKDTLTSWGALLIDTIGSVTVICCEFTNNVSTETGDPYSGSGAAIYKINGLLDIIKSTFCDNYADFMGGAIFCWDDSMSVYGSKFINNSAGTSGGAIMYAESLLKLTDCTFLGNCVQGNGPADGYGGAVFASGALVATNCAFSLNRVVNLYGPAFGGAVVSGLESWFTNCAFSANKALGYIDVEDVGAAGGALIAIGNMFAVNCTFAGNKAWAKNTTGGEAYSWGGALYADEGMAWIGNSILWGNCADSPTGQIGFDVNDALVEVTYSDVQGGWTGTGNIDADPLFVRNPNARENEDGILILRNTSPCVDTGSNALVPGFLITDLAGFPRIINLIVDRGAFELTPAEKAINNLIISVQALVTSGALLPAQGRSLIAKLEAAQDALTCGDLKGAAGSLKAFMNQVRTFAKIKKSPLTLTQASTLISDAKAICVLLQ